MKNLPLREDVELVEVCECGHTSDYHDWGGMLGWDCFLSKKPRGKCQYCTCNKFHLERKMLENEYEKLGLDPINKAFNELKAMCSNDTSSKEESESKIE